MGDILKQLDAINRSDKKRRKRRTKKDFLSKIQPKDEPAFYESSLHTLGTMLNIPVSTAFTFGKNILEEVRGKETGDAPFAQEMKEIFDGDRFVSFHEVMKAGGVENLDIALPEGYRINNIYGRVAGGLGAGLLSGFATANPFVGVTAGIATFEALGGKGAVSSVADVALDPLNKLRIAGYSNKALGFGKAEVQALKKAGLYTEAVAKRTKSLKAQGLLNEPFFKSLASGERKFFDLSGDSGLHLFGKSKLAKEAGNSSHALFLGSDLGFIVPSTKAGMDLGRWTGVNLFADAMEATSGAIGQYVRKYTPEMVMKPLYSVGDTAVNIAYGTVGKPLVKLFKVGGNVEVPIRDFIKKNQDTLFKDIKGNPQEYEKLVREGVEAYKKAGGDATKFTNRMNAYIQDNMLKIPEFKNPAFRKLLLEQISRDGSLTKEILETGKQTTKSISDVANDPYAKTLQELEKIVEESADKASKKLQGIPLEDGEDILARKVGTPQALELRLKESIEAPLDTPLAKQAIEVNKKIIGAESTISELEEAEIKLTKAIENQKTRALEKVKLLKVRKQLKDQKSVALNEKNILIKNLKETIQKGEKAKSKIKVDADTSVKIKQIEAKNNRLQAQINKLEAQKSAIKAQTGKDLLNVSKKLESFKNKDLRSGKIEEIQGNIVALKAQKSNLGKELAKLKGQQETFAVLNANAVSTGRASVTEANAIYNAIHAYNPDLAKRIKLSITDDIGKPISKTEYEVGDAIATISRDPAVKEGFVEIVVRMHKPRTVETFARLVGGVIFKFTSPADLKSLSEMLGVSDMVRLEEMFIERFAHGFNARLLAGNPREAGLIAKALDKARLLFDHSKAMFSGFDDELVQRRFDEFISNKNFFDDVRNARPSTMEVVRDVRKLLNEDGTIVDSFGFKRLMDELQSDLVESGYFNEFMKLRASLHGIGYEPVLYKDKEVFEDLVKLSADVNLKVNKRDFIGSRPMVNMLASIQKNDNLKEFLIRNQIVSKKELDFLLNTKLLTNMSTVGHQARSILIKISSVAEIKPYELLESDPITLLLNYGNAIKNKEYAPFLEWVNTNMKFRASDKSFEMAKTALKENIFKVYLSNDVADSIMNALRKMESPKNRVIMQDVQGLLIEGQRNNSIKNFREIHKKLKSLIDENLITDQQKIDLEQVIRSADIKENLAGKELLDGVDALYDNFDESFIDDILKTIDETGDLSKYQKGQITKSVDAMLEKQGASDVKSLFDIEGVQNVEKRLGTNFSRKIFEAKEIGDVDKVKAFTVYQAKEGSTSHIRNLNGAVIPKQLVRVLDGITINAEKNMSDIAQAIYRVVHGFNKVESEELATEHLSRLNKVKGVNIGDTGVNLLSNVYQRTNFSYLTSLWKTNALLSPAFHIRNAISAISVNSHHGVGVTEHIDSLKFLFRMSRASKAQAYLNSSTFRRLDDALLTKLKETSMIPDAEDMKLYKELTNQGIIGSRIAGQLKDETQLGQLASLDPTNLNFGVYQFNFKAGESIEDWVRISSYKHARNNLGMSPDESANFVKLLHFDYNELTAFEKSTMKQLIPFYSYFRLSMARDSRMFLERTGEFIKLAHLTDAIERGIEPEESVEVASYIRENIGVRFHVDENGKVYYFLLGGLIPAADLIQRAVGKGEGGFGVAPAVDNFITQMLQGMNPLIKTPFEIWNNKSYYFDKPIERFKGEQSEFFGVNMDVKTVHMIRNIRWLNDMDKVSKIIPFLPHGDINPDIPLPSSVQEKIAVLIDAYSGVKVKPNLAPERQRYYQEVLPRRDALQMARKQYKLKSANFSPAFINYMKSLGYTEEEAREKLSGVAKAYSY